MIFVKDKNHCGGNSVVESQLPKLIARVRFPSPARNLLLLLLLLLGGCATSEGPHVSHLPEGRTEKQPEGVYHKVEKGQTLWRIAKAYGVPVDEIIRGNNIPNAAAIEVNQLILIPGAKTQRQIAPRTPDENKDEFIWPLKGKVTSYFKDRQGESTNRGLDIEAAEGDTVKASREGRVVMADYMAGYGQTIMLDHGDGFLTVYAQNRKIFFKVGDHVYKGDPIGEVGRVGRKSYIHFELRRVGAAVNPLYYLP